jgi:hypothetical protein
MVTQIKVTFSEAVSIPSLADAFKLERYANGTAGTVGLVFNQVGANVTITFDNSGTIPIDLAGSLADGTYRLTINADKVSGVGGFLDGNKNGTFDGAPADNVIQLTHRLFGDGTGDGAVTSSDFAQFRTVFGVAGPTFDFDGNGVVNSNDFAEFRKRFGLSNYQP